MEQKRLIGKLLVLFVIVVVISLMIGNCTGRNGAMKDSREEWKKEKETLLLKADSLRKAAIHNAHKAREERVLSEEREQTLLKGLKLMRKADSLDQIKLKADLRYYRALSKKTAKEIQQLMLQQYETDTAYHNSLVHPQ